MNLSRITQISISIIEHANIRFFPCFFVLLLFFQLKGIFFFWLGMGLRNGLISVQYFQ